jgi:Rrf2 family transcriptional regulator, nitric oxide-sensitive transcriptional repressor
MFSQTVEYALRAMKFLASQDGAAVNNERIAAGAHVPPGYLSKIMRDLVVGQLVLSFRGPRGGFLLARPSAAISILDIVNAVDPIRRIHQCPLGDPSHANLCTLHRCLDDTLARVERSLARTTLAHILTGDNGPCRLPQTAPGAPHGPINGNRQTPAHNPTDPASHDHKPQ